MPSQSSFATSSMNSLISDGELLVLNPFKRKKTQVAPFPSLISIEDQSQLYKMLWERRQAKTKDVEYWKKRLANINFSETDKRIKKLLKLDRRREHFAEFTAE